MNAFDSFSVVRVPFPFTDRQAQKRVRLKLFTLDERLVLSSLGALSEVDRVAVIAQLAKLLPHPIELN